MKLLLIIYSGSDRQLVPGLLDRYQAGGFSELPQVHGAGTTGRREGSRAWPGDASIYFSVVPAERADALTAAMKDAANNLPEGERLHAAILPTEDFF
ncbi:MAG: hypothetical protein PVH00_02640 [Gemmatimonadota bacterium]|jgi:hypothetical protein